MSCNLLTARSTTTVMATASDTLSEVSENSGWTSVWESKENLQDLATKIGLQDVSDLHQDRFRVDRKKLEHMLIGDTEAPEPADTFFHKIMEDTNTYITWPSRLKIGAKSKKDPYVRIAGRIEDLQTAKERIINVLNTKCNRVTMKMDVSYTDHSHIIGRGGLSIKRVMEETQCHVHFPDSNRSNPIEKSNQVSIAGDIDGVEKARSRVRNLIPLIFSFELPILSSAHSVPDTNTPYVIKVQQQFNVQVMFRTRPKLHATLVMVKGVEWEVQQLKQATLYLIDYMCENLANQITIQMSMEISPHLHQTVIGKNHSNLKAIIQNTGTQIMFPDAQDPNIPNLKKSNVTICGNIHNVYTARQQLMGSLPLVLMFDLPEDISDLPVQVDQIAKIQSDLDVTISIRNKAKQNTMACIIKGIERYAVNIYEARNKILRINEPWIVPDIPSSYFIPQTCINTEAPPPTINVPALSPLLSPMISPTWPYPQPTFNPPPFVGLVPHHSQHPPPQQFVYNVMPPPPVNLVRKYLNGGPPPQPYANGGHVESHRDNVICPSLNNSTPETNHAPSRQTNQRTLAVGAESQDSGFSSILSEMISSGNYHGPTVNKRTDNRRQLSISTDYEQKRLAGFKAMQNRQISGLRTTTNSWSGFGLSRTSPGCLQSDTASLTDIENDFAFSPVAASMNTSNLLDHMPNETINNITSSKWNDVTTMLVSLGLEQYIRLFTTHEIDLTTFQSMTEKDLLDLGITSFGARRKIVLTISELNRRSSSFSMAPGAERKNTKW